MSAVGNGKWIADIGPQDHVRTAAHRTLEVRLNMVQHYLPLAATQAAENVEYVHQLRVATRRAVAAIEMYHRWLPNRAGNNLKRQLKQIRRAAGRARDLDVLLLKHEPTATSGADKVELRKRLQESRCAAQQPILQIHSEIADSSSLSGRVAAALAALKDHSGKKSRKDPRFKNWARARLRRAVKQFLKAEPKNWRNLDAIHQFRIQGKQLRYTIELLSNAFPTDKCMKTYAQIQELQEMLGEINDHTAAAARFRRWRKETDNDSQKKRLKKVIAEETKQQKKSIKAFKRWWMPERRHMLKRRFKKLLQY